MKKIFENERMGMLEQNQAQQIGTFTEESVRHLPEPVKKYLSICGYMNMEIPINANIYWSDCHFRMSPEKNWGRIRNIQFNTVNPIGRVAYMKFEDMPISGCDKYYDGYGEMCGKLMNLFKVVFDNSHEVAQSALITVFAEFFLVPGYLLSENVKWDYIDGKTIRATLTDKGITVSGLFHFGENGLPVRFETDDRYYSTGKNKYKKVKFSVYIDSYKNQGNIKIAEKARAVWHLPGGDYEYFKGIIDKVEFNVR